LLLLQAAVEQYRRALLQLLLLLLLSCCAVLSCRPTLDAFIDQQVPAPVLTLVSDAGNSARVVAYNIFAGRVSSTPRRYSV
jgi:hypothetical protein